MDTISYPPCTKGIRPGIREKPAEAHEAGCCFFLLFIYYFFLLYLFLFFNFYLSIY